MADKKIDIKNIESKIKELKIELLKSPMKRARIKKEIARLLTMAGTETRKLKIGNMKAGDSDADAGVKTKTKLTEGSK